MKTLETRLERLEAGTDTASKAKPVVVLYDPETGPPALDAENAPTVVILLPRNGREAPDEPAD